MTTAATGIAEIIFMAALWRAGRAGFFAPTIIAFARQSPDLGVVLVTNMSLANATCSHASQHPYRCRSPQLHATQHAGLNKPGADETYSRFAAAQPACLTIPS